MTGVANKVGICLDCNYPLHDLPEPRCPECGRGFVPDDPTTQNMGQPIGAVARWILAPLGRARAISLLVWAVLLFWVATDPGLYDYGMSVILPVVALALALIAIGAWEVLRVWVAAAYQQPAPELEFPFGRPSRAASIILLSVAISIPLGVPLRIGFAVSRVFFDEFIHEVQANPSAARPGSTRLGIYAVNTQIRESNNSIMVFTSPDMGFAFSKDGRKPDLPGIAINSEEHLQGPWYWFVGD
ncbi:MAG TPA: hypothetical protein VH518_21110 [Tepidisphaeraceae bacterium]|jgi:hypothetical protein